MLLYPVWFCEFALVIDGKDRVEVVLHGADK